MKASLPPPPIPSHQAPTSSPGPGWFSPPPSCACDTEKQKRYIVDFSCHSGPPDPKDPLGRDPPNGPQWMTERRDTIPKMLPPPTMMVDNCCLDPLDLPDPSEPEATRGMKGEGWGVPDVPVGRHRTFWPDGPMGQQGCMDHGLTEKKSTTIAIILHLSNHTISKEPTVAPPGGPYKGLAAPGESTAHLELRDTTVALVGDAEYCPCPQRVVAAFGEAY
ncbi:unnamed protein product, partial [Mesorhabditis spiculigera]